MVTKMTHPNHPVETHLRKLTGLPELFACRDERAAPAQGRESSTSVAEVKVEEFQKFNTVSA
jgi:hypothetical protein